MARHGENIRKRKDGRWEGRYPVYNVQKAKQVYHSVYGRTYEEVREKLTTQKNLLKNPVYKTTAEVKIQVQSAPKDIMLADAALEWLAEVKSKKKLSTYVKYKMVFHSHLEKTFQNTILSELTDVFVRETLPNHLSDNTLNSIYCVLNQILKFASRQYSIIVPNLKKPASDTRTKPVRVLAKNEQKKLISVLYCETDLFKTAVLLCLFTGLRLGELCALKWEDIDFENKILTVSRTVQRLYVEGSNTKTVLVETTPKSAYSRREIPLSDAMLKLLMLFRSNKEYIFGGSKAMEPRTLQYHFKKILKEAGLADTNFHILRHTFSTNCIEGGTDVKSLSEMLGHSDVQITLNRYVHPSMDTKRQYIDSLSRFYGQINGQAG